MIVILPEMRHIQGFLTPQYKRHHRVPADPRLEKTLGSLSRQERRGLGTFRNLRMDAYSAAAAAVSWMASELTEDSGDPLTPLPPPASGAVTVPFPLPPCDVEDRTKQKTNARRRLKANDGAETPAGDVITGKYRNNSNVVVPPEGKRFYQEPSASEERFSLRKNVFKGSCWVPPTTTFPQKKPFESLNDC